MIEQTDRVAHYSRLEHVANILHDKKLLIGPVYNCADPREASMGWLDTEGIGYGPDSDKQRTAKEMICRVGRQVRLLCTMASSEPVSQASCSIEESIYCRPRMWAQYGDQSRGFCVVLNREALNNRLLQVVERDDYLISAKVKYFPWLEMVGGDTTIPYGPEQDPRDIDIFELMNENGMLQSIYFKKSIDWKEECEYRWLVFARTEKPVYVSIENSIEAVVLGSHFPLNQVSQVKGLLPGNRLPLLLRAISPPEISIAADLLNSRLAIGTRRRAMKECGRKIDEDQAIVRLAFPARLRARSSRAA